MEERVIGCVVWSVVRRDHTFARDCGYDNWTLGGDPTDPVFGPVAVNPIRMLLSARLERDVANLSW